MSSLSNIEARVQQNLALSHSSIVLGVYDHMLKTHNEIDTCNCDYCSLCREYVEKKRELTRFRRRAFDNPYEISPSYGTSSEDIFLEIAYYKASIKDLKKQKDALKVRRPGGAPFAYIHKNFLGRKDHWWDSVRVEQPYLLEALGGL